MANILRKINKKRKAYDIPVLVKTEHYNLDGLPLLYDKQQDIYEIVATKNDNFYILVGGIGSGKTFLNCRVFLERVLNCKDSNAVFGLVGHTHTAIQNVLINEIQNQLGTQIKTSLKSSSFTLFNKKVIMLACGQLNDYQKWMGINLSGAWGTEAIQWREDNYSKLLGRIRENEAWCILDTNPSHPNHWLKEKIDNNNLNAYYINTRDNKHLPNSYIEKLEKDYSENDKRRWLRGEWVGYEDSPFNALNFYQDYKLPLINQRVTMFIDLAYSNSNRADSTAISIIWLKQARTVDDSAYDTFNIYGELLKGGWGSPKNINRVMQLIKDFSVNNLWVEKNLDSSPTEHYNNNISNCKDISHKVVVRSVRNSTNKQARIANLIPYAQNNKLHMIDKVQNSYYSEIINYAFDDKLLHDDAPDSLESAIRAYYSKDATDFEKAFMGLL